MRRCLLLLCPLVVVLSKYDRRVVEAALAADRLAKKGDHEAAIVRFEGVLEDVSLVPDGVLSVTWFNYALSLTEVGRHVDGGSAFLEASKIVTEASQKAEASSKAGDQFAKAADWRRAVEAYGAAADYGDLRAAANAGAALMNCEDLTVEDGPRAIKYLELAASAAKKDDYSSGIPKTIATHLAVAYALDQKEKKALKEISKVLVYDDVGAALALAMLLESKAHDLDLAVQVLEASANAVLRHHSLDPAFSVDPQTSSLFYRLARLLDEPRAKFWREKAVELGIWQHELQMPGFIVPQLRTFPPRPFIDTSDDSCEEEDSREREVWRPVVALAETLERDLFPVISREYESLMESFSSEENIGTADLEKVAEKAELWRQIIFKRNGKYLPLDSERLADPLNLRKRFFPKTLAFLRKSLDASLAEDLPKSSAEISIFKPGTVLKEHCGPSNHRIRLHLCIDTDGDASLTVGGETRRHKKGKVLAFDDSFLHSAENPSSGRDRIVLLIDVWHPFLNESARNDVRNHFHFNDASWNTTHSPFLHSPAARR